MIQAAPVAEVATLGSTPGFGEDLRGELHEMVVRARDRARVWGSAETSAIATGPVAQGLSFEPAGKFAPFFRISAIDQNSDSFTGSLQNSSKWITGLSLGAATRIERHGLEQADWANAAWQILSSAPQSIGPLFPAGEIVRELRELNDGWNGPGSFGPSARTRADVQIVSAAIVSAVRVPEIEVDDDGSVALLWEKPECTFALTFLGNGRVVGTVSPYRPEFAAWTALVSDVDAINERLNSQEIAQLIA